MIESPLLIVENDQAVRNTMRFVLRQAEFPVSEAADSEQALRWIARELPTLILLDWLLPGLSGLELVRVLKKDLRTQEIPIIMLAARDGEDDIVRGLESGALRRTPTTKPWK